MFMAVCASVVENSALIFFLFQNSLKIAQLLCAAARKCCNNVTFLPVSLFDFVFVFKILVLMLAKPLGVSTPIRKISSLYLFLSKIIITSLFV